MKTASTGLLDDALLAATYAIAQLDGALSTSVVRHSWHERAVIVGLANCLALAGQSLAPAEFFRAIVGLVEPQFLQALDRGRLSAVVETALPALAPATAMRLRVVNLAQGAGLIIGAPWRDEQRPPAELRAELSAVLAVPRADVGTAMRGLAARLPDMLAVTWRPRDGHQAWPGWLAAALLPAAIASSGLTAAPLPCLTGLSRAMRYRVTDPTVVATTFFTTLADQAKAGLATLRRLEACHGAWRDRLEGLTSRSRARAGAALFLVLPAMTRGQVAISLGLTPAGAGKLLIGLVARDIVTVTRFGQRTFYVAEESLGDFKLTPRQGRSRAAPKASDRSLLADLDAAMAVFDQDNDLNESVDQPVDRATYWPYQHQP